MNVIDLLRNDNYIMANKTIAKTLGLDEAILIGEFASEHSYWEQRNELQDGYFYSTVENVENNTTLSSYRQRSALNTLKKAGIVDVKVMGLPARRFIKINPVELERAIDNKNGKNLADSRANNTTASYEKNEELVVEEFNANNNNTTTIKNKNNKDNINPILYSSPCESEKKAKEVKHTYGEYENVKFTDTELAKLKEEFPSDWQDRINKLSGYMASTGKTYKNHLATIRNWARMEQDRQKTAKQPDPNDGWAYLEEQYRKGEL